MNKDEEEIISTVSGVLTSTAATANADEEWTPQASRALDKFNRIGVPVFGAVLKTVLTNDRTALLDPKFAAALYEGAQTLYTELSALKNKFKKEVGTKLDGLLNNLNTLKGQLEEKFPAIFGKKKTEKEEQESEEIEMEVLGSKQEQEEKEQEIEIRTVDPDEKPINIVIPLSSSSKPDGVFEDLPTDPKEYKFMLGGKPVHSPAKEANLTDEQKTNIIKQINKINAAAYEKLAKENGFKVETVNYIDPTTQQSRTEYKILNEQNELLTPDQHQKFQQALPNAFNEVAKDINKDSPYKIKMIIPEQPQSKLTTGQLQTPATTTGQTNTTTAEANNASALKPG